MSWLDPLNVGVEEHLLTPGIDGVEPTAPTVCVEEGPTTPWLKGGPATTPWLKEGPTTPWLEEGPTTPWLNEGPTTSWLKGGPAAFQVGLCEQRCVNVLGNYNDEFTSRANASVNFDGFLQESSKRCLSPIQSSAFSISPTLKSSRRLGSRSQRDWSSSNDG